MPSHNPSTSLRVLIADDVLETRRSTRLMLAENPSVEIVAIAHNGREAVELAQEHRPDIALMDINMPEMNGFSAYEAMREANPGIACIFVSAERDKQSLRDAMSVGAREYITKPFTIHDLNNAVDKVGKIVRERKKVAADAERMQRQHKTYLKSLAREYKKSRRTDDQAVEVFEQLAEDTDCKMHWLRTLAMIYVIRKEWEKLETLANRLANQTDPQQ